jgi:hypothetical protein
MRFRMKDSVFPGDVMEIVGTVTEVAVDDSGCGWAAVELDLSVDGASKTGCAARIAVPVSPDDNPWARRGERWRP